MRCTQRGPDRGGERQRGQDVGGGVRSSVLHSSRPARGRGCSTTTTVAGDGFVKPSAVRENSFTAGAIVSSAVDGRNGVTELRHPLRTGDIRNLF